MSQVKRMKLIEARESKGLTRKDMARLLGITVSFYGKIERGERNPILQTAQNIASILDSSIDDLFFGL